MIGNTVVAYCHLAGITAREKVLGELQAFELRASDPLRYFSPHNGAGKAVGGDRLTEEKQRRRLDARLTSLSTDLSSALDDLWNRHGDVVPHANNVSDYRVKMRGDRRAIMLELEAERRRRGSAAAATAVPMPSTIGTRYPVLPPVASSTTLRGQAINK